MIRGRLVGFMRRWFMKEKLWTLKRSSDEVWWTDGVKARKTGSVNDYSRTGRSFELRVRSWASFAAWLHHVLRWRQLSFPEKLAHRERESYILEPGIDALGIRKMDWESGETLV